MDATVAAPAQQPSQSARPLAITILAGFSLLLGIVTAIPQLYYVLFAINQQVFPIGPTAGNPLGQVWYWYILNGDNTYRQVNPGVLAGAVEDAFLLGPLYLATGIGLLRRSAWVVPVGLMTGAMIFYAILQFFLGDIFAGLPTVTNGVSYWATNLPYLLYPLLVIPTLLRRRSLFSR
jgi:emopamil binding protein